MKSICQNCGWIGEPKKELEDIEDLADRVAPGETVPSGECDECGALCHLLQAPRKFLYITNMRNQLMFSQYPVEDLLEALATPLFGDDAEAVKEFLSEPDVSPGDYYAPHHREFMLVMMPYPTQLPND